MGHTKSGGVQGVMQDAPATKAVEGAPAAPAPAVPAPVTPAPAPASKAGDVPK
jgi:hypothetical protein